MQTFLNKYILHPADTSIIFFLIIYSKDMPVIIFNIVIKMIIQLSLFNFNVIISILIINLGISPISGELR